MSSKTDQVVAQTTQEFPSVRFVRKEDSALCRIIDVLLRVLTLGAMSSFLKSYYTTIGCTVYLPASHEQTTDETRAVCLRHERVHLRQWRELGYFGMAATYLLPILPIGLALGRAFLEQEAYEETLRAMAEYHGIASIRRATYREFIVSQFTGPAYGWMWPFRCIIESWYDRFVDRLEATQYRTP